MRDQLQFFFRSADAIDVQDPETEKRHAMRSHGDREDHLRGFVSGRAQGLSLTLGPRRRPAREASASASSMSSVLQQSRFAKPARELLDEVVSVSSAVELSFDEEDPRKVRSFGVIAEGNSSDADVRVIKLVALLDELEKRYQQYFHRMEQVISSFEIVAGSGAAGSYTGLTIQAMSRHFANLRNAIITQIHRHSFKHSVAAPPPPDETRRLKREALQKLGIIQNKQVWRPLKGLPEDSVSVLRTWLFENFLHPYPDENEKLKLVSKTGLTRNQISNWFINARVRIWKPMIEEMYQEEFSEDSGNMSPSCRSTET